MKDLIGDYYCTCPEGFSGRNCEINRKCASNPCKNEGVCVEVEGGFQCVCPEGVTGTLCEVFHWHLSHLQTEETLLLKICPVEQFYGCNIRAGLFCT